MLLGLGSFGIPFKGSICAQIQFDDDENKYDFPLAKFDNVSREEAKEAMCKLIDQYFDKCVDETPVATNA